MGSEITRLFALLENDYGVWIFRENKTAMLWCFYVIDYAFKGNNSNRKLFTSILCVCVWGGGGGGGEEREGPVLHFCKESRTTRELKFCLQKLSPEPASVAQLDAPSDWRPGGCGFNPRRGRQHSFVEIDHEIFSTVILSLPLIQEGQLSVSGERMCTILVNRLED